MFNDKVGTINYQAPELHFKVPYKGEPVDVFAMAVCLFSMVLGHQPFHHTKQDSPVYKCLAANKPHLFWNYQREFLKEGLFDRGHQPPFIFLVSLRGKQHMPI